MNGKSDTWVVVLAGGEGARMRPVIRRLPAVNFSKDVLERDPRSALLVPLIGVSWCDWGRPERVAETLKALGRPDPFGAPVAA